MGMESSGKGIDNKGCLQVVPPENAGGEIIRTICGPLRPKGDNGLEGHRTFSPADKLDELADKLDPVAAIERAVDNLPKAIGSTVVKVLHIPPVVVDTIKEAFED